MSTPRPDDVLPRVLVDWRRWDGDLEACRREADGTWRGWVRWSEGVSVTTIGWFREPVLTTAQLSAGARTFTPLDHPPLMP
jgi:hypothetical protein